MSSFERALTALLFAAGACGCATTQIGKIAGTGPAAGAALAISRTERDGVATVTLENGERCSGRFNTVPDRVTWDDERVNYIDSEDSRVGMLVVSCPSGYTLRCDFAEEATGPGHGACRDPQGAVYALVL